MKKEKIILIGITLIAILLGLKPITPKAAEINYTGQFRLQYYQLSTGTTALTNVGPFNTGQTLSSGYGVSKVITRYSGQTFNAGTIYRVQTIVGFAPSEVASSFRTVDSIGCFGTTSSSNWNADSSLIASCDIVGISQIPNTNRIKYIVDITPASNVAGIQFNINYAITEEIRTVNVYTASTITTGPDIAGSIDEQTAIIEEEFDNLSNIITENNQNLINSITEQNQVCSDVDYLLNSNYTGYTNGYINTNGNIVNDINWRTSDYLEIDGKVTVRINYTGYWNTPAFCTYTESKSLIECRNFSTGANQTITYENENAKYIRSSYSIQSQTTYVEIFNKLCKNGNQALIDADHNYTEEDISGTVSEYEQQEEELETITDIDLTDRLTLNWNTGTLSWIWTTFDTIRGAYLKVFAVMTSFLALGVIRLVLNR